MQGCGENLALLGALAFILPYSDRSRRADSSVAGDCTPEPVTSASVLIGWLAAGLRGSRRSGPNGGRARSLRIVALVSGMPAAILMGIVACTAVTGGTPEIKAGDGPVYRASASASAAESAASSSARESERLESQTVQAVHTVCEALSTSSADAVDAVNAYVRATNTRGDIVGTQAPAADALNRSADVVSGGMNDSVPPQLQQVLTAWIESARAAASAVSSNAGPDDFNKAINQVNDARTKALNLCDASY